LFLLPVQKAATRQSRGYWKNLGSFGTRDRPFSTDCLAKKTH